MATSDYASPAQARLMRARAHGWRPKNPRKKLPSAAVAKEFVEAKDRKYAGGFAENRYADGGPVEMQMGGLLRRLLEENPEIATALRMAQRGERYDPGGTEPTLTGLGAIPPTPARVAPITTGTRGPMVAPPPRAGRESPHRERLRAHRARVEDILRGEPRRVKTPPAPSGPIKMQMGGLAAMMAAKTRGAPRRPMGGFGRGPIKRMPPRGGIPPGQPPGAGRGPIRAGGPGGPRGGGFGGRRGPVFGGLAQMMMQRQGLGRRGGRPPPGMMGGRGMAGGARNQPPVGPRGGPQFPPNLMGMFQRMRMQNRPRMGGVGGGNRVGQADQQGALARALQRGTGRPPMSRRYAFPGRR